jgi:hypothetical protein
MKKLFIKIQDWFLKITRPLPTTQDEINFDLERFNIRFCKKCDAPFVPINEKNYYCSKACRIRFNNKKRKK